MPQSVNKHTKKSLETWYRANLTFVPKTYQDDANIGAKYDYAKNHVLAKDLAMRQQSKYKLFLKVSPLDIVHVQGGRDHPAYRRYA